ncbi:MAG: hypothetical protein ACR2RF_20605, partial [Geminicoccaceae bacterium]
TVIERMTEAYLRARNISTGDLGAATPAMLAAVRELFQIAMTPNRTGNLHAAQWLSKRVKEHERRSEGDEG